MKWIQLSLNWAKHHAFSISAIVFGILFWLDLYALYSNSEECSQLWLKQLIFLNCLGFLLIVVLINVWSIYQTHKYLDDNQKKILEEKDLPCDYCGHKTSGPLLCYECNSILWGRINSTKTDVAVFIAQHRWSIISGLFALFFIAPISFLYTKMNDFAKVEEMERIENTKSLNQILDNLSVVRSKIVNLETAPYNSFNLKQWDELHTAYTSIYWNIVPAFERLLESATLHNPAFARAIKETDDHKMTPENLKEKIKEKEGFIVYAPAFLINHKDFELSSVTFFLKYMDAVSLYQKSLKSSDKKVLLDAINARKTAAKELYHRLRITSIMLRLLIDSKWLLKDGVYPSESADQAFYFNSIFVPDGLMEDKILNLKFNFNVRQLDAFKELKELK